MLELVSREARPLSELIAGFRSRYFISGEINSEVEDQEGKLREIAEHYADGEISWLDGVSVDYPDWHFNVRPSNTSLSCASTSNRSSPVRTWRQSETRCWG